ncbi:MAG: cytidine deaminase [Bacteroidetes bacterium]|nr:cytidine deaminase [Bacteroidota bacterium]
MQNKKIEIGYRQFDNLAELEVSDQNLINRALEACKTAYAPYSNFPVGAAVLLDSGEIFIGNNQENISFPAGTCAERTLLNFVHANFPEKKILTMAITATNSHSHNPVTPCGVCRQVMVEMEREQDTDYRVLLHKPGGSTIEFSGANQLLPLAFEDKLKK